jgi:hypothetical protein
MQALEGVGQHAKYKWLKEAIVQRHS